MEVNGHVVHGVWERREEEEGGVGLFSIPSSGGLWTCVCVSFGREWVGRVEGGGFPEHSYGFRFSRFFCG